MELLDRYLQAVRKHLPWKRQDDIVAELRANLESQLEEKEAELGRPLSAKEAEEWLKPFGHPIVMAAKYQPVQYLIGPGLFPMYLYVMKLALLWASIVYAVVSAVVLPLTTKDPGTVVGAIAQWPSVLFTTAAWVTLVFAVLELLARTCPGTIPQLDAVTRDWKPGSLPPIERDPGPGRKPRSYVTAVAEVVFGFLVLAWLLLIPHYPFLLMGPGEVVLYKWPLQLAPVWWWFYWSVVGLNVVQLTWRCVDLMRETWHRDRTVQNLVNKTMGVVPLIILISAPGQVLVEMRNPVTDAAQYGKVVDQINKSAHLGFLVVLAIVLIQLLWDLGQLGMKAYRSRAL